MNSSGKRINLISIVILSLILLAVGLAMLSTPINAKASGSDIDYSKTPKATVSLDVNGDSSTEIETNIVANNGKSLKSRRIDPFAFILGEENLGEVKLATDIVGGDTSEFFEITSTIASSKVYYFDITAKKATTLLKTKPLIKLTYTNSSSKKSEIYIAVDISATFVPGNGKEDAPIIVGAKRNADNSADIAEAKPIPLTNFTTKEVDLTEYIESRTLSLYDESTKKDEIIKKADGSYFVINDAKHLKVTSAIVTKIDALDAVDIEIVNDINDYTTSLILKMNIPENVTGSGFTEIWTDPTFHGFNLSLTIDNAKSGGSEKSSIIHIPVIFTPNKAPVIRSKFLMSTSINAGSKETSTGTDTNIKGYSTIRVYPTYLIEYPHFYGYKFMPDAKDNPIKDDSKVVSVVSGLDESGVMYWDITGLTNDSVDLVFTVYYGKPIDGSDRLENYINVPVTFNVYGKYNIDFGVVKGTKANVISYDSTTFSSLTNDGYRLTGAAIIKLDSADKNEYASLSFADDVIEITGKINCGRDAAVVALTLVNMKGQTIEILVPFSVDLAAGDFFSGWAVWKIILFWVGIGIAIVLFLLFVIWIFMRSIHKRKMDELETSAPTSAYIIKLNSTIAAAQAQQRLATTQAFSHAQTQMLQLGAGPVSVGAPPPNTLQLGATAPAGTQYSGGAMSMPPMPDIAMPPSPPPAASEIYIPISDDDLLEQIFVEKFEPRGMLRRTFFKSKDLQQRELEKEKERIREDVRNGMTIEEACRPLSKRKQDVVTSPKDDKPAEDPIINILGFDPNEEIIEEEDEVIIAEDATEADRLRIAESNSEKIAEQQSIIEERLSKTNNAISASNETIEDANGAIEALNAEIDNIKKEIDDLSFRLATSRGKDRDRINKDIESKESEVKAKKDNLQIKKAEIDTQEENINKFKNLISKLETQNATISNKLTESNSELENARKQAKIAAEREERARKLAELERKLDTLNPLMMSVNKIDREIIKLGNLVEMAAVEKSSLKMRQQSLQTELLSTTSSDKISALSEEINALNKKISELDKNATANTKLKSDKAIEINGLRRKANELIEKEKMELDEVIASEDKIIGEIALSELKEENASAKNAAEERLAAAQARFETLSEGKDAKMMQAASAVATEIALIEEDYNKATEELNSINERIETTEDDSEKMDLTIEQVSLDEKVSLLKEELESKKAEGIKRNLENQLKGEAELEEARVELEKTRAEFEAETERYNNTFTNINPLDLISSGSGLLSQDRKKVEAENLKKQLEESKNAMEEARIQAQLAHEEAEKAIQDAKLASDASKAEAERFAQEAIAKAEAAKSEAERKAMEEAEKAKTEAQLAKSEAEQAKKAALEEAELAKKEALEEAELAKKAALEEAEKARLAALEEVEAVKRAAEQETSKAKLEAESAKVAYEEEAESKRKQNSEKTARINEKVTKRKVEIAGLRGELKTITDEESATTLKEKFYSMLLSLDEDEKSVQELTDLLNKSMEDANHAGEIAVYKKMAANPKRIVKKITERVNVRPRSAGARPAAPGARPAGARPTGARPAAPGARPAGARPTASGARPAGARPTAPGARPAGARPTAPGARPAGARPTAPGARPAGARPTGARPAAPGARPTGTRPAPPRRDK